MAARFDSLLLPPMVSVLLIALPAAAGPASPNGTSASNVRDAEAAVAPLPPAATSIASAAPAIAVAPATAVAPAASPAERRQVRDRDERACRDGDAAACVAAALLYDDPTSHKSLALVQRGCDLGQPKACQDAATYLYMEALDALDEGMARRAYRYATRACSADDRLAVPFCRQVADSLVDGFGVSADPDRGERMLREQCERHPGAGSCTDLGRRYLGGDGVFPSVVEARAVLRRGCDAGDVGACDTMLAL